MVPVICVCGMGVGNSGPSISPTSLSGGDGEGVGSLVTVGTVGDVVPAWKDTNLFSRQLIIVVRSLIV